MNEKEIIKILDCEDIIDITNYGLSDLLTIENNYNVDILKKQAIERFIRLIRQRKTKE